MSEYPTIHQLETSESDALIIYITSAGIIEEVVKDELDLKPSKGDSLFNYVDEFTRPKIARFLLEVRKELVVFGWEINILRDDLIDTMQLAGVAIDERTLVVVASTPENVRNIWEELAAVNNEQANALRTALKELEKKERVGSMTERELYDELSRQNNELITLQRRLVKSNNDLARANALKTRFMGMASHDMRKPLSIVMMYFELLTARHGERFSEEDHSLVSTIDMSLREVIQRINELLDLGQIDSGMFKLKQSIFELNKLTRSRVAVHTDLAASKQIRFELDMPDEGIVVNADNARMQQVWDNLLDNATKYSPRAGRVIVKLERDGEEVIGSVADQGVGIPKEQQADLFDPYTRADVPTTGGESSTGLGLAICKAIIAQHGGQMWLESEVGKGTTVYFTLPII